MSAMSPKLRHAGDTDDVLGSARSHVVDRGDSLLQRLVETDASLPPALARVALGLVMLPHVLQKTFGWFGGHGLGATYYAFTGQMGIPGPLAFLAIVAEVFGVASLLLGVLSRVGAAAIISVMLGAIAFAHLPHGFFMDWQGTKGGEGFEYHLLAIALGLVVFLAGGGAASIDRTLMRRHPMEGGSVDGRLTRA
jgi:putative oxidoreductase